MKTKEAKDLAKKPVRKRVRKKPVAKKVAEPEVKVEDLSGSFKTAEELPIM